MWCGIYFYYFTIFLRRFILNPKFHSNQNNNKKKFQSLNYAKLRTMQVLHSCPPKAPPFLAPSPMSKGFIIKTSMFYVCISKAKTP